ncbi:caspase family protein [Caldilinea sp.]|uniref:caspase family protein n=1 Tax=Caldilinea sp. TaxID=2293560 RepID=UPI00258A3D09|nr:caspase family protein [Caldilinea sp.]
MAPFDLPGSALSAEDFTAALRRIQARRLLVLMDCCHAAGMATAKDAPPFFAPAALPKGVADALKQDAGRAVFSSSTGAQVSWVQPDGSLSLYTYHLIEALQGAGNRPGDTVVRLSDLMNYLGKAVPAGARALGKEQTPFFDTATEDFPRGPAARGQGLAGRRLGGGAGRSGAAGDAYRAGHGRPLRRPRRRRDRQRDCHRRPEHSAAGQVQRLHRPGQRDDYRRPDDPIGKKARQRHHHDPGGVQHGGFGRLR